MFCRGGPSSTGEGGQAMKGGLASEHARALNVVVILLACLYTQLSSLCSVLLWTTDSTCG